MALMFHFGLFCFRKCKNTGTGTLKALIVYQYEWPYIFLYFLNMRRKFTMPDLALTIRIGRRGFLVDTVCGSYHMWVHGYFYIFSSTTRATCEGKIE